MDGYELARRIRDLEGDGGDHTVLLAFTANTLREAADECHAAGMDDVLTKPIELADLRAKLEHWLPLRTVPTQAPTPSVAQSRAVPQHAPDTSLTVEFCLAHDEDMDVLRDALQEQRHDAVARAAHRIMGAARMYGDNTLAEAAAELEEVARAGGAWGATESAARRVDVETRRLFETKGWSGRRSTA
jgi:response regulator RpfG family c-di-GMP phosphodiesterase